MNKPYAFAAGEGRAHNWHDVTFIMKASGAETDAALSIWEVMTRPGEEPGTHTHDDVHEMFYLLFGSMTFRCGKRTFKVEKGGFVFLPRGIPHGYTVRSRRAHLIGMSTPSDFGDHIERTGTRVRRTAGRRAT